MGTSCYSIISIVILFQKKNVFLIEYVAWDFF